MQDDHGVIFCEIALFDLVDQRRHDGPGVVRIGQNRFGLGHQVNSVERLGGGYSVAFTYVLVEDGHVTRFKRHGELCHTGCAGDHIVKIRVDRHVVVDHHAGDVPVQTEVLGRQS